MATHLILSVLGGVELKLDDAPITGFISNKVPALLTYLVITAHPATRDALAALLWGDMAETDAKTNLRQALANTRKLLSDHVHIERETVAFDRAQPHWVDAQAFANHIAQGTNPNADKAKRLEDLQLAVQQYRGDFLQGLLVKDAPEFDEWVLVQRERYREMMVFALQTLAAQAAAERNYNEAIARARHLLALDPWREETHRQIILWLARTGHISAALKQFEACKKILRAELNVEPSAETVSLAARIRAASQLPRQNISEEADAFVGRAREAQELAEHLLDPRIRLVTVTGAGGMGKTRLARHVARHVANEFINGVCYVSLAALTTADTLEPTLAAALGVALSGAQEPRTQLLDFLHEKEILLLLDNYEQLLPETRLLVELLKLPGVKLLVTSRERLALRGEVLIPLEGLPTPSDGETFTAHDAAALFIARARHADPSFVAETATRAIFEICRLVEGLPLGVELAAAWTRVLPVSEIARELRAQLDFLISAERDVPARQASLRAVFEHSWQLLTPQVQRVFADLALFRASFTRSAADAISAASVSVLAALVDKSLVRKDHAGRYSWHPVIHQYALEKLAADSIAETRARAAYCAYYANFLAQQEPRLVAHEQQQALAEIGIEFENLRQLWEWLIAPPQPAHMLDTLGSVYHFFLIKSRSREGADWFARAVAALEAKDNSTRANALALCRLRARHARFLLQLGQFEPALAALEQNEALARAMNSPTDLAFTLTVSGSTLRDQGEYVRSAQQLDAAYAIRKELHDDWGMASALMNLAGVAYMQGDYPRAADTCRASLELYQQCGDPHGIADLLFASAAVARIQEKYDNAANFLQAALPIYSEIENVAGKVYVLNDLALLSEQRGEFAQAQDYLQAALELAQQIGDNSAYGFALVDLGRILIARGEISEAVGVLRHAMSVGMRFGATPVALQALAEQAALDMLNQNATRAAELAGFLIANPASFELTRKRMEQLVSKLETVLDARVWSAALERGKTSGLSALVRDIAQAAA